MEIRLLGRRMENNMLIHTNVMERMELRDYINHWKMLVNAAL